MGIRIVHTIIGFNILSVLAYLVGVFRPQHTVSFFSLYGFRVARVWTYLGWVKIETSNSDFCDLLGKIGNARQLSWCDSLDKVSSLQDFQQRMCSPAFQHLWPSYCTSLQYAYGMGVLFMIILFGNFICQFASMYLAWEYAHHKQNRHYRLWSMTVLFIGLVCGGVTWLLYFFFVISGLTDIQHAESMSMFSAVLSVSRGTGFSEGYVLLLVGGIFQGVAVGLYPLAMMTKQEEDEADRKALREHEKYGTFPQEVVASGHGQPQQVYVQQPSPEQQGWGWNTWNPWGYAPGPEVAQGTAGAFLPPQQQGGDFGLDRRGY